ncbi:MAG: hypothetical protein QOH12_104 [Solirubrobacteraceae bacterium]|nr:hypothetical protein [Solirubrobacteraceae bacterium]
MEEPLSLPPVVGVPNLLAGATAAMRQAARGLLAWIRERLASTPGRLTLISAAVVIGAVIFGTITFTAERAREGAAKAVANQTEPLLLGAVELYASLSQADATATTTFLAGGLEPPDRRALYVRDIATATAQLVRLGRQSGAATSRQAVATITEQLPVYTGLIEAARANNRQDFPVGAAYQRQASGLLSARILPAAGQLYESAATRLNDDYRAGVAGAPLFAFVAAVVAAFVLLFLLQRHLARITRRVLNVPILAATGVLAVIAVWGLAGLTGEQDALTRAQRDGSDSVELLSATQILAFRAQADESLALVARGGDPQPFNDFDAIMHALVRPGGGGLVGELSAQARRTRTAAANEILPPTLSAYRARHAKIVELVNGGKFAKAVQASHAAGGSSPADRLSANLKQQIGASQTRFVSNAGAAGAAVGGLTIAIPLLSALAAILALSGLRQRINEYR